MPPRTPTDDLPPLGQRLERLRLEHGIPRQQDAADQLGISVRHYSRIIHAQEQPRAGLLLAAAKLYQVDHTQLLQLAGLLTDHPTAPNGTALARLEAKLDYIIGALIASGTVPDPPDELAALIRDATPAPHSRRRTSR